MFRACGFGRNTRWTGAALLALALETGCGAGSVGVAVEAPRDATRAHESSSTVAVAAPEPVLAGEERSSMNAKAATESAAAPAPPGSPPAHNDSNEMPHSAAMLIYTANLSMAVFQVAQGIDAVDRIGRQMGGYLSTRSDNAVTIRVGRDRFQEALSLIEKLGDVTHRDIKAEDVTDTFVDLAARLKNAYAMRDRLTELLQKAQVKEAIEIQKQLGQVTEDIERMEGKLKLLKDQIAFSTINVSFSPVQDETVHDTSLLAPFPWLEKLGLSSLLSVRQ
jgi:hypothetical protein